MEKTILKAEIRAGTGKKAAKDLRAKGVVPANVYKGSKGAESIRVTVDDLNEALHTKAGENVIITLKIASSGAGKDKTVVIKEIQRDPVKGHILHVDFNEISLTEELKVNVPLVAHGEPVGVKTDGGVLEHVIRELQVECLPTAIPEKIEVEVSGLKIGDAIHVKDIAVPQGVRVLNDKELIALIVKPPKVEVVAPEAPAEGAAEPELIRKKKEEEAAGEEGAKPAAEKAEKKEDAKPAAGKKEEKK